MKTCIFIVILVSYLAVTSKLVNAETNKHFIEYDFSSNGFKAAFPSKPTIHKTDFKDGGFSTSYQSIYVNPLSQYSVLLATTKKSYFQMMPKEIIWKV